MDEAGPGGSPKRSQVSSARSGGYLPGPSVKQVLNVTHLKAHWYQVYFLGIALPFIIG